MTQGKYSLITRFGLQYLYQVTNSQVGLKEGGDDISSKNKRYRVQW